MHPFVVRTVAALAVVSLTGCTAGIATARLLSANRAVHDIENRGAVELAPYEHALAVQHLDKALEESANSQFKTSVDLSKASIAWCERAVVAMEGGGRDLEELAKPGEDLDDFESIRESKPEDTPKPADDFDDFLDEQDESE